MIRDEPDHPSAGEEYFKIQIGPLVSLPDPIQADKWKRLTFQYTTGEYLLAVNEIGVLVVHSNERKLLSLGLRERATQSQIYEVPKADLLSDVLAVLLGIKELDEIYEVDP